MVFQSHALFDPCPFPPNVSPVQRRGYNIIRARPISDWPNSKQFVKCIFSPIGHIIAIGLVESEHDSTPQLEHNSTSPPPPSLNMTLIPHPNSPI